MNFRLTLSAGVTALMLILTVSCSSGSPAVENPASPDFTRSIENNEAGHYLWAYYQVYVDPVTDTYDIQPFRQVTDHWNILKFLEKGPCTNCVSILGFMNTPDGTKKFDVQISHPFPTPNLTGFDVRGIALFAASHNFPVSGLSTSDRSAGDGSLVNADGYTTLYNGTTAGKGPGGFQGYFKGKYTSAMTPNSLLNGYIRHISPGATNLRNMFYSGSSVLQTYEIDMPDTQFIFGYAVDASWANPTTKPVTNPGTDFPPSANCQEPWKVAVTEEAIGQGLHDQGGQTKLHIDVYDHQGKISYFAPVIECPELFAGTSTATWASDGDGYTRFDVTIDNEKIAPQGEYMALISVTDTADATSPDWVDLTAYQIVNLTVGEFQVQTNQAPTAAAHSDKTNAATGETINFLDDSTDPDGYVDIVKWEWDFSYDVIDGFQGSDLGPNPSISYPGTGNYQVQLRVTDSAVHTDMLNTPISISVGTSGNVPPVACGDADNTHPNINQLVHFYDCSIDEDGLMDMVYYEWDLDGDGFYEKNIKDVTKIYSTGGDYNVQHRVTDSADNIDLLDVPVLIEVNGPPVADAQASLTDVQMGQQVTLTNMSSDTDGNGPIIHTYWDLNGNGIYGEAEDAMDQNEVDLWFYTGGVHEINIKVEDQYGLQDEIDNPIQITVQSMDPFCVELQDQWNSADHLYGNRVFNYYQGFQGDLDVAYKSPNGPWDFTSVPVSQPAICEWFTPGGLDVSTPASIWPNADFFFKEAAPVAGGSIYAPHTFVFDSPDGDYLQLDGQWQQSQTLDYGDTFQIHHPICHPWADSGSGVGDIIGLAVDISWSMTSLGTGPAIFQINNETVILNCMLIRHNISFVDTEYGVLSFSLLNYQWIDENGNEVAFMEATNGLEGNNFSGNNYTGEVICRPVKTIN